MCADPAALVLVLAKKKKVCALTSMMHMTRIIFCLPLIERDKTPKWRAEYKRRLSLLSSMAPSKTLLEAGPGSGSFSRLAADNGFSVTVLDGSQFSIDSLTSHPNISGRVVDLNDFSLPANTFGACYSSHTIEHLENPFSFLKCIHGSLLGNGVLYLSFPVYERWVVDIFSFLRKIGLSNYMFNFQAPDHVSYFTAKCIKGVLVDTGFEVISFRRIKFISALDIISRSSSRSLLRKLLKSTALVIGPVLYRIGYYRDVEIICRRGR